ncbi:hypothetical protein [Thioflexithrix psekupsensis]|nr:hypothetical protein [Thioflexithrix psekupsensis]
MNTIMLLVLFTLLGLILAAVVGWFLFAEHGAHPTVNAVKTDDDQHLFI